MKMKLYIEDYEHHRYNSEGQTRKSSHNASRSQSLLNPPASPKMVVMESQGSDKFNKSQLVPSGEQAQLGLLMSNITIVVIYLYRIPG